jgi:hypothetical protein
MISTLDAIVLISTGVVLSLVCATYGVIIHMRYLDRKLIKPVPKAAPITQQIPAVKP